MKYLGTFQENDVVLHLVYMFQSVKHTCEFGINLEMKRLNTCLVSYKKIEFYGLRKLKSLFLRFLMKTCLNKRIFFKENSVKDSVKCQRYI